MTLREDVETREQEKAEEAVAHRFAAAFLVPAEVAMAELGSHRRTLDMVELWLLKEKYGLSMQAWIRRARELDIITDTTYKGLCVEFSRRGWRKAEPFECQGVETPMKLRQMALRAVAEGRLTPERAEALCPGYRGTEASV